MKLIHNITFLIEPSIHVEWFNWMVESNFPDYKNSDVISGYKLSKIFSARNTGELSFALHLEFDSKENLEKFLQFIEPVLLRDLKHKFQNSALTFSTSMEIINEG